MGIVFVFFGKYRIAETDIWTKVFGAHVVSGQTYFVLGKHTAVGEDLSACGGYRGAAGSLIGRFLLPVIGDVQSLSGAYVQYIVTTI